MRSALVFTFLALSTVLYFLVGIIPVLIALCLPKKYRGRWMRYIILYYGLWQIRVVFRPFFKIEFRPQPDELTRQAGIYVFNHRSASDPFLVALFGKEVIQIVNGWPMKLPFYGFFARLCEYIDATRTDFEQSLAHIGDLTSRGVSVMAFPEGTRSGNQSMNHFHSGIFRIARELKLPIYPCAIAGNERLPDRSFRFHDDSLIIVAQLAPISADEVAAAPTAYALKQRIHLAIAEASTKLDAEIASRIRI